GRARVSPCDAVGLPPHGELQEDGHLALALRDQLADGAAHARDLAVERPHHRIEQSGLSRARLARDDEQPPALELHGGLVAEGGEPADHETDRFHETPAEASSITSRK